jgi:hypothetical protein
VCVDCGRVMTEEGPLLGGGFQGGETEEQRQRGVVLPALWRRESNPSFSFPFSLVVGGGGGGSDSGGRGEKTKEKRQPPPPLPSGSSNGERRALPEDVLQYGEELIWQALSKFHMECNQQTRERALELFENALIRRREKMGGRKEGAEGKGELGKVGKLAAAFALARTLNELQMPRPLDSLVQMCELHNVKEVLRFGSLYHATTASSSSSSSSSSSQHAGELNEAGPEEHVDGLCAILAVPYRLTHTVRHLLSLADLKHRLYGSRPHHIAGGALLAISRQAKVQGVWNNSLSLRDVSETMDCRANCIKRVLDQIPKFSLRLDSRPPMVILSPWPECGGEGKTGGGSKDTDDERKEGDGERETEREGGKEPAASP